MRLEHFLAWIWCPISEEGGGEHDMTSNAIKRLRTLNLLRGVGRYRCNKFKIIGKEPPWVSDRFLNSEPIWVNFNLFDDYSK